MHCFKQDLHSTCINFPNLNYFTMIIEMKTACKVFYILSTILLKLCSAQTNSFVKIFKNPYKKLAVAIMILKTPEFPLMY